MGRARLLLSWTWLDLDRNLRPELHSSCCLAGSGKSERCAFECERQKVRLNTFQLFFEGLPPFSKCFLQAVRFPDGYVNKKLEFWGDLARRVKTSLTESKNDVTLGCHIPKS